MVEAQNVFTFDYLVFVLSAAVIACLGLTTNSGAVVVAAMLISPLMGPIVAVALGLAIQEWSMVRRGFINELAGTLLVFLTGFFWGLGTSVFPGLWETDEQEVRTIITTGDTRYFVLRSLLFVLRSSLFALCPCVVVLIWLRLPLGGDAEPRHLLGERGRHRHCHTVRCGCGRCHRR
jgi:ABC-type nickel/cobalt efflux system permease component RcnA